MANLLRSEINQEQACRFTRLFIDYLQCRDKGETLCQADCLIRDYFTHGVPLSRGTSLAQIRHDVSSDCLSRPSLSCPFPLSLPLLVPAKELPAQFRGLRTSARSKSITMALASLRTLQRYVTRHEILCATTLNSWIALNSSAQLC